MSLNIYILNIDGSDDSVDSDNSDNSDNSDSKTKMLLNIYI